MEDQEERYKKTAQLKKVTEATTLEESVKLLLLRLAEAHYVLQEIALMISCGYRKETLKDKNELLAQIELYARNTVKKIENP